MATEKIFFAVEVDSGQSVGNLEKLRGNLEGVKNEIKSIERARKRGSITAKEANKQTAALNIELTKSKKAYNDANKAAAGLTKKTSGLTKAFNKFGLQLAAVFGARAILQGIGDVVNIIKDFDQASANLAAVLGKSADNMAALQISAKELGATTSFTASQVVELQTELAKLGFTEKEILGATEATLALAEAAGAELGQAAKVVGSSIRAFGLEAKDATRITDVMAKSFSSSALDIGKFETAMSSVAPAAAAAGLSIEETTAMLGVLTDNGVDASTAGTALRGILLDNAKAGRTLEESLELVNSSTNKNATSADLFGKRGAVVAQILAQNVEKSDLLTESLENSGGAAQRMAETQLDTLEGKAKLLTSAWEGFVLSLDSGDGALSRMVGGFMELTTNILGGVTSQEKMSSSLRQTNMELNAEFELLKTGNITQAQRSGLIEKINGSYGEYTGFLIQESTSLQEIERAQKNANKALKEKIVLAGAQEELTRLSKEAAEASAEAFRVELKIAELRSGAIQAAKVITRGVSGETQEQANEKRAKQLERGLDDLLAIRDKAAERVALFQKLNTDILLQDLEEEQEAIVATVVETGNKRVTTTEKTNDKLKELQDKRLQEQLRAEQDAADRLYTFLLSDDEREIQALNQKYEELFNLNVADKAQTLLLEEMHQEELTQLILDQEKKRKEKLADESGDSEEGDNSELTARQKKLLETWQERADITQQGLREIQDLVNVFTGNKLRALEDESKAELAIINQRERDGLLTEQQAEQARRKLAEESDKKAEAIEKKAFQRNKAFSLANAIINTARAVAQVLPNIPLSLAVGGIGAVEVAAIASQKFQQGGIIKGNSHASGGVPIMGGTAEVEGSEIILTKGVTANPSLRAAANQLNILGGGQSFLENGGVLSNNFPTFALPESGAGQDFSSIVDAIAELRVIVDVSEISGAQNNVAVAEGQAEI